MQPWCPLTPSHQEQLGQGGHSPMTCWLVLTEQPSQSQECFRNQLRHKSAIQNTQGPPTHIHSTHGCTCKHIHTKTICVQTHLLAFPTLGYSWTLVHHLDILGSLKKEVTTRSRIQYWPEPTLQLTSHCFPAPRQKGAAQCTESLVWLPLTGHFSAILAVKEMLTVLAREGRAL